MKSRGLPVFLRTACVSALVFAVSAPHAAGQSYHYKKQGFTMKLCFDNRGSLGRTAYPGVIGGADPGPDSVGLAYPIGQTFEHVFGGGLWVGGRLDTAVVGNAPPVTLVTAGYEGWNGPYFEFFPGTSPADTIWQVSGRGIPRPPEWDDYWGNLIPRVSFSDNDDYCLYDDNHVRVANHIPLHLKVAQSSFVWQDPYAEAIDILEYRIVNTGVKEIDSAYVGLFLDPDVGPFRLPNYQGHNYTGYYPDLRTAFAHDPPDPGATPVGVTLLSASRPLDSLRNSYRWWRGTGHPNTDPAKFAMLSAGLIDSNQSITDLSEIRFLVSTGPFPLRPAQDTVVVVFALLCGQNLAALREHSAHAKEIYQNGGVAGVGGTQDRLPSRIVLFQNYPNPFNPSTTIRFTVSPGVSGRTTLRVFDVLGRLVATLVDDIEQPGTKLVRFNAEGLATGVYLYRLDAGLSHETRKLIVLR